MGDRMADIRNSFITITASEMRAINRSSILDTIRCIGPISRAKIASELRISIPTVSRIVDALIAEGWLCEIDEKESSGGRKRGLIQFNGSEHHIIGIDMGGTKIFGALVNLHGEIIQELYYDHKQTQAEESVQVVDQMIDELLFAASGRDINVRGIGIGVPGITDPANGAVSFAPALDWRDFPLKHRIEKRYQLPVVVENDVNLATLGEVWFSADGSDKKNIVLIALGTGIGAGIVINGDIYSGVHHMAGEIGYLLLDRSQLGRLYPDFGAFEQIASGSGIAKRGQTSHEKLFKDINREINAEDVFTAANRHELWAVTVLEETIDYLAQAIAAVTLLYDPDEIVLSGGVSRSADQLIEPILKKLEGAIPIVPKLRISSLGYRGAIMGAVLKLLRIISNHVTVYKNI